MSKKLNRPPKSKDKFSTSLLLGMLFLLLSSSVFSQIMVSATSKPASLVICESDSTFSLLVANTTGITMSGATLLLDLPTGCLYVAGSIVGGTELNISNLNQPTFNVQDILNNTAHTIEYNAELVCGYTNNENFNYILTYNSNNYSGTDPPLQNYYYASLVITNITNSAASIPVNQTIIRDITVEQQGANASIDTLILLDEHTTDIEILAVSIGTLIKDTGPGPVLTDTIIITGPDLPGGDGYFSYGESIVVSETVKLLGCDNGQSTLKAAWGCYGDYCNFYTAFPSVSPASGVPLLNFAFTANRKSWGFIDNSGFVEFTITNSGSGAGTAYDLVTLGGFSSGSGTYYPNSNWINEVDSFSVNGNYLEAQYNYAAGAINGQYAYFVTWDFTFDPDGAGIGLEDADGDGFFDDLPVGNVLTVKAHTYYDWAEALTNIATGNSCGRGWTNNAWQGFRYGYDLIDQCGDQSGPTFPPSSSVNQFMTYNTNTLQHLIPSDIYDGTPVWMEQQVVTSTSVNNDGCPNDSVIYQLILPPGVVIAAGTATFKGASMGAPMINGDTVVYFLNKSKILSGGWFRVPVKLDCNVSHPPTGSISTKLKFWCDKTNYPARFFTYWCSTSPVFGIQCPPGTCTDPYTAFFAIQRTTLGWVDNQLSQRVDPTNPSLNLDYAFAQDSIRIKVAGAVNETTDSLYFIIEHGNLPGTWANNLFFTPLNDTLFFRDKETSQWYTCPNTGPVVTNGSTSSLKVNISDLTQAGGCLEGITLTDGDSMIFMIYGQVRNIARTQWETVPALRTRFYSVDQNMEKYCNDRGNTFNVLGSNYNYVSSTYIDPTTLQGCMNFYYYGELYRWLEDCGGVVPFPNEVRPLVVLDSMVINLPPGFYYQPGTSVHRYRAANGSLLSEAIADPVINTGATQTQLIWVRDASWKYSAYYDCSANQDRIQFTVTPSCQAGNSITYSMFTRGRYKFYVDGQGIEQTATTSRTRPYIAPEVDLTPLITTAEGRVDTVFWEVRLCNITNLDAENNWLAFESASQGIEVVEILDISNATPVAVPFNAYSPGKYWIQPGQYLADACYKYRIKAIYSSCSFDSLYVRHAHNCVGYPINPELGYPPTAYSCYENNAYLYLDPKDVSLNLTITSPVNPLLLCDTLEYEAEVTNTQLSYGYDLSLTVEIPPGVEILPAYSSFIYPAATGSYVPISDPANEPPGSNKWVYHISDDPNAIEVLKGVDSIPKNSYKVHFRIITDCNLISGTSLKLIASASNACGDMKSRESFSSPILIDGLPVNVNLYVLSNQVNPFLPTCSNASTVKVKIINLGPNSVSSIEKLSASIDDAFDYVPGSLIGLHNGPTGISNNLVIGGIRYLQFDIQPNLAVNDSIVFTYNLTDIDPGSLVCDTIQLVTSAMLVASVPCVTAPGGDCLIQSITTSIQNQLIIQKDYVSFGYFTATSFPDGDSAEMVTISYNVRNDGVNPFNSDSLDVVFYHDANGNGLPDEGSGDSLYYQRIYSLNLPAGDSISSSATFRVRADKVCHMLAAIRMEEDTCICSETIIEIPDIQLYNSGPDTLCCTWQSLQIGSDSINGQSYIWVPSNYLSSSTSSSTEFLYNGNLTIPDTLSYMLITNRPNGCINRDTIEIIVFPTAAADAGSDEGTCQNTPFDFSTSATLPTTSYIDSLQWIGGAGSFIDSHTLYPVYYPAIGEYGPVMLGLVAYGTGTCDHDTSYMILTIDSIPAPDFTSSPPDTVCTGQLVTFTATDTSNTNIISWNWNFGDGNTATGQVVTHTYANPGTFNIMLIATNDMGCSDTVYHSRVAVDLSIDFSISPTPSCINDTVWFSGIGNATFTDWIWDFGDGNSAIGHDVFHIYTTYDTFNVQLDVCSESMVHQHIVIQAAESNAGSDESICEHYSFDFTTSVTVPGAMSYDSLLWYGGAGTFSSNTVLQPAYTPAIGELGVVRLWLVAYGKLPCSNDTSFMDLMIFDGPEADFTISPGDSICVDEVISLDASSTTTITDWLWNYGDGNSGIGQNVLHAYTTPGIYDITLIVVNEDLCSDTVIYSIEVFELPVADFTILPNDSVCRQEAFSFAATSSTNILNWHWDFGDGNTSNIQNPTHTYVAAGIYDVSLFVYNENSCRDTVSHQVRVFELPVCDFSISPNDSSCVNEMIGFTGTGTADITTWNWDFGDGNTGAGQFVTHAYTAPGTYSIQLIAGNGNTCVDTVIYQRVVVEPVIDFTVDLPISCEGYNVNFSALGNYDFTSYVWDFGDGNSDIGRDVSHTFNLPNTYTVTLTFCTSQVQHDILVNPLPEAYAGQDTVDCEDVPFDLSTMPDPPTASNYSYIGWYGGLGTFNDPTLIAPVYTPEDNEFNVFVDLYMVAYGIDPCHNDTSMMTIYVTQGAYAFAGSDEDHCQGEPYDFANSTLVPAAYNETYRMWSGGAGFFVDPTAEVPIYIPAPNELGPVMLTMVASNILNCDSIDDMILTIHPVYDQTQYHEVCFGDSLLLPGGTWVSTSGVYSDTLMSVWNCDSVIGTTVFVYPKIDADFTVSPNDSTCIGESVTFTKTGSANLQSWYWDFGDGNGTSNLNPEYTYADTGVYLVTFSYMDDLGCFDTVRREVSVFEYPDVDFTSSITASCNNTAVIFNGISNSAIKYWDWDFGDGNTGAGQNVSHQYFTFGFKDVTLTVTATNLCQSSVTYTIFMAEPPEANFTYNITRCDTIGFIDLSTCPGGFTIVEWDWDFGDGDTSDLQNPSHIYSTGGVYDVQLIITADSNQLYCYDTINKVVVVPEVPTVYFSWTPEPTCLGNMTQFFGTSGNPITEWYWDFDDGNYATIQDPQHTYAAAGVYNVMLFATDQNGCWDTVSHDITISDIPDVSITVDPNPTCSGEQTSFSGNSASNIGTWLWDFGDGGSSLDQNPLHVFATPGTYQVTLWVSDTANCFNSTSQWVSVNPMPLPDFTHSGTTCLGDSVFFYNQSVSPNGSISQWIWNFGDGNSVTINAPNDPDVAHVYATGATFNVTLTVVDIDSCSNFVIKPVTVTAGPIADFNYEDNCSGQPVQFTDLSSPGGGSPVVSWFWEFDDPASGGLNTSTLQNPVHLFSSPGTFDVLLVVTNADGCADTTQLPVNVSSAPMVSFTTDGDSACVDAEVAFFGNASTGVSWLWDFGDGGISVLQDPVHVYDTPGTYTVTVVVEDAGGCMGTYSSPVYINPLPIADYTYSSLPCSGAPVDFIDISSAMNTYMLEWHWYFGDGSDTIIYAPSSGNVSHTYATAGNYTVSLAILNANNCEDSIAYEISVIQGPEAGFEYSGDVCQGGTVEFTDMSQGFGYLIQAWLWTFGDPNSGSNNQSSLQNPTHVYSSAGTYFVSLTVTSNTGCQHTTIDTVVISPPPGLDWFTDPDTTCFGELTYFFTDASATNISEVITYAWNFGDPASGINDTSNLQNPVHQYTAPGNYVVTMSIVNIDGCLNTRIREVEIKTPPVADYTFEQSCLGDSTLFFDQSISQTAVITGWMWTFGDPASGALNTSDLQNTGHVFTDLGTYNVELITTDYFGCSDTIEKTIEVDYAPTSFYKFNQPCEPAGLIFFNDSSYTQTGASPINEWLWELEPGQFSTEINPIYTFAETDTTYVVYLTVTDANACKNTFMDSVRVDEPLILDFMAARVCHQDSNMFVASYSPSEDIISYWQWNFGDGNIIMGSDTMYHTYAQPGTYFVTLTIENQKMCEQSVMHQIMVDALPAVDFSFSPSLCDEPTYFTDMTDPGYGAIATAWSWNFDDIASGTNNFSLAQNPMHIYPPQDSIYFVKLQVINSFGCTDSLEKQVPKGLCMKALFEVSGNAQCNNTEVCFKDSSYIVGDGYAINTWQWAMGDGQWVEYNEYQDSICHEYAEHGEYMVQLIVYSEIDGTTYSDTTYRSVIVSSVPSAAMAFQAPCVEGLTRFFDISNGHGVEVTSWQWDFGVEGIDTDTSSLKNPSYSYQLAGVYTVQLIVENANGCEDTLYQDIEVYNNPDAAFSSSIACAGGFTEFTDESTQAEGELAQWLWSFGNGETSDMQNPAYVYADTGNYLVQMVVGDKNQCSDTTYNMLSVYPVPISAFDIIDLYENIQGQIKLDNLSESSVRYMWDLGNGDTSELFSPVVRYEDNGTYLIELISWNDNNCPDTAYMEYIIEFQGLYVPTGFTPTSTNLALREFIPAGINLAFYELTIINQWGNVVFKTNKLDFNGSPSEGWDGSIDGDPQPTGTYMWTISARFKDGSTWTGTDAGDGNTKTFGTVLLIR